MQAKLYYIHALSPLHAGTGQGVGVIDLPIAREKATNIPYVPGSSIKGVLRDRYRSHNDQDKLSRVFGPNIEDMSNNDYASSLQITDARLLLLPVRSLAGTFAWVTSPYLLQRYSRDAYDISGNMNLPDIPQPQSSDEQIDCLVAGKVAIVLNAEGRNGVFLEDLDFSAKPDNVVAKWADHFAKQLWPSESTRDHQWRAMFRDRLCVVPDDALSFLLETATEVVARIRLEEESKTVAKGQLWYEEALPSETVLSGLAVAEEVKAKSDEVFAVLQAVTQDVLQLGGKATVGRGLCRMQIDAGTHGQTGG